MSTLGEVDAKFPGQVSGLPPSPSVENPGQVFPKFDPHEAKSLTPPGQGAVLAIGNPFLMNNSLDKVDDAFQEVISILLDDKNVQGSSNIGDELLQTFKNWRAQLSAIRSGRFEEPEIASGDASADKAGGIFTD